jgi:ribosomal protein S12 methylthiotransferase accessory factor
LWFRPYVSKKSFARVEGLSANNALDAVTWVARRVSAAGFSRILFKEITREDVAPARAVRVVVPGVETNSPLYSGVRARTRLVADLMHRHSW